MNFKTRIIFFVNLILFCNCFSLGTLSSLIYNLKFNSRFPARIVKNIIKFSLICACLGPITILGSGFYFFKKVPNFEFYPPKLDRKSQILLPSTKFANFDLVDLTDTDLAIFRIFGLNDFNTIRWNKKIHVRDLSIKERSNYLKKKYMEMTRTQNTYNEPLTFKFFPPLIKENRNEHHKFIGAYFHNSLLFLYLKKSSIQSNNNNIINLEAKYNHLEIGDNFIKGMNHSKFFKDRYKNLIGKFSYFINENRLSFDGLYEKNLLIDNKTDYYYECLGEFLLITIMSLVFMHGAWHLETSILLNIGLKTFKNTNCDMKYVFKYIQPGVLMKLDHVKRLFSESKGLQSIGGRSFDKEPKVMEDVKNLVYRNIFKYENSIDKYNHIIQNISNIFTIKPLKGAQLQAKNIDLFVDNLPITDEENQLFNKCFNNHFANKINEPEHNEYFKNFNLRKCLKQLLFIGSTLHSLALIFQQIFFCGVANKFDEKGYWSLFQTFSDFGYYSLGSNINENFKNVKNPNVKKSFQIFSNRLEEDRKNLINHDRFLNIIHKKHDDILYEDLIEIFELPFFKEEYHVYNNSIRTCSNLCCTNV